MHYTPHRALKSSKRYYNRYVLKLGFIGQKTLVHKFTQIFDQLSAGDLFITFSCQRGVESRELGQLIRGAWQHAMHMCILYIMQTCHAFFYKHLSFDTKVFVHFCIYSVCMQFIEERPI